MNEKIIYKWGPVGFGPTPIRGHVIEDDGLEGKRT